MTALIACETVLLALLTLLVAGLLRSHAEILRRLGSPDGEQPLRATLPEPGERAGAAPARDLAGTTPDRDAIQIGLGGTSPPTLLAFLTTGCTICHAFWEDLRRGRPAEVPAAIRIVAVTKDSSHESPASLRQLAPDGLPVVMSTDAWNDYRVPAAPYFVYVAGGEVQGEGSASSWRQIASLLGDAIDDLAYAHERRGGERRADQIDRALATAGIGPGHPSLYPAGLPGENHPNEEDRS
ncbi:MAG: TlpA family protein disulfide reductase [Solirubrobacteraceae bacterium]|nr:MAG: hypothetical protein DLM63_13075 [Solirubrobacterales bacterium]